MFFFFGVVQYVHLNGHCLHSKQIQIDIPKKETGYRHCCLLEYLIMIFILLNVKVAKMGMYTLGTSKLGLVNAPKPLLSVLKCV